jgi:hypothetical protein
MYCWDLLMPVVFMVLVALLGAVIIYNLRPSNLPRPTSYHSTCTATLTKAGAKQIIFGMSYSKAQFCRWPRRWTASWGTVIVNLLSIHLGCTDGPKPFEINARLPSVRSCEPTRRPRRVMYVKIN